jgi:membrane associated rhomboid family serine protease
VSGYFRFNRPGRGADDPWFRIGSLDVGTTMLIVLLSVVSLVVFAVEPIDKPIENALAMYPDKVHSLQLWRLVSWPFANTYVDLWVAVTIFFFWYFGTELERLLGRARFATFFFGTTIAVGVLYVLLDLALPLAIGHGALGGLQLLGILVLLVFIGEYPHRRFFFNIPGWVIGLIFVGIQVIQYLGVRDTFDLIAFLLSLVIAALMARSVGLLAEQAWIPRIAFHRPAHRPRGGRRSGRSSGPTVVAGPWQATAQPPVSRDQAALDALLDKISAGGMDSLTDGEREQLMVLRDRLRRR